MMIKSITMLPDDLARAYVAGVLHGDGSCANQEIRLKAKDKDFVEQFAASMRVITGRQMRVRQSGDYWATSTTDKRMLFGQLKSIDFVQEREIAAWIRGMFDSDGNASFYKMKHGERSYGRRIAIYKTKMSTVEVCVAMMERLGIKCRVRETKNSKSHYGTKLVYEVNVNPGLENYSLFRDLVSSSIRRKADTIAAICSSYKPDRSQCAREAQLKGAAARQRTTLDVTLPSVLAGIRRLVEQGVKPTQQVCSDRVPKYTTIQRYFTQSTLVKMAMQGEV